MPDIYWLIAAQRRYLKAMQPREKPAVWSADYQMIGQRLAATFPDAAIVIVRDRLHHGPSRQATQTAQLYARAVLGIVPHPRVPTLESCP